MKVMVIVKASKASEAGEMPSEQLLTEMGQFNEELAKAGIMLEGAGLHPSSKGARVRFSGKNRMVIDGPFAETKELIAGYWLWQVKSLEEAIEWVKRCPNPMNEDSDIEIRPLFEAEDFGETMTPKLREQEAAIKASTLGLGMPTFVDAPERTVAGLSRSYTGDSRHLIPSQWQEFVPVADKLNPSPTKNHYGVCWCGQSNDEFNYLTGVDADAQTKLPEAYTKIQLPAGRYAVFTHQGDVTQIASALDTLWGKWATDCGLAIAPAPWFERYTEKYNPQTGRDGIEFWIPIQH